MDPGCRSVRCGVGEDRGWGEGGSATGYKCWTGDDLGWVQLPNIHVGFGQEMTWGGFSYRRCQIREDTGWFLYLIEQ